MSSSSPFSALSSARARLAARVGARTGLVQITAGAVLWGTAGVAVQLVRGSSELEPVSIGFYRLVVAAAVLLLISAARARALVAALRSSPLSVVLVGVGLATYQALYLTAVSAVGVSVATVVSLGLAPVLTAGWEAVSVRRLPGRGALLTLLLGIGGLVLIAISSAHPTTAAPRPVLGLLAAAGSGLGYAATTVLSRHVGRRVAPRDLSTLSCVVGAVTLLPLALAAGTSLPRGAAPVALLVYLGVMTTAAAYGLFYAGLRTTSSSVAALLTLLEPLTAALLARVVLSEPLPLLAVVGGVLLLSAVAALYRIPAPPAPA